jgi:hypothetical protein
LCYKSFRKTRWKSFLAQRSIQSLVPTQCGRDDVRSREPAVTLSEILTQIAADETRERISLADLVSVMDDRAIGALIFVFAIPNIMPLPPGASTVLGAPLLFLTAQLALGKRAWLPQAITKRTIDRGHFAAAIGRLTPWLIRAERLLSPRLLMLTRPPVENLIGVVCFLLASILFLPIPMGNMPPAIAICLFALAILERDGLWVIAGAIVGVAAIALIWGVLFALVQGAFYTFDKLLG